MGIRSVSARRVRVRFLGPALRSHGMVTIEAAFAIASLCAVAVILTCVFAVVSAQLRVSDAARTVARAAATGAHDVTGGALGAAPEAQVSVTRDGPIIAVRVWRTVTFPVPGMQPVVVSARAEVLDETSQFELLPYEALP